MSEVQNALCRLGITVTSGVYSLPSQKPKSVRRIPKTLALYTYRVGYLWSVREINQGKPLQKLYPDNVLWSLLGDVQMVKIIILAGFCRSVARLIMISKSVV